MQDMLNIPIKSLHEHIVSLAEKRSKSFVEMGIYGTMKPCLKMETQ